MYGGLLRAPVDDFQTVAVSFIVEFSFRFGCFVN